MITFPFTNIRVSLAVLLGWIMTAVLATPADIALIGRIEGGQQITSSILWAAVIGTVGFIATTLIHLQTQSSGPAPTGLPPKA
jgi:hypothetical protein